MYSADAVRNNRAVPARLLVVRCCLGVLEDVEALRFVFGTAADLSSSLSDPALSAECKVIQ